MYENHSFSSFDEDFSKKFNTSPRFSYFFNRFFINSIFNIKWWTLLTGNPPYLAVKRKRLD